jgi:hypothetical protein
VLGLVSVGLLLEEFIAVAIEGLQQVTPEVGLRDPTRESGNR